MRSLVLLIVILNVAIVGPTWAYDPDEAELDDGMAYILLGSRILYGLFHLLLRISSCSLSTLYLGAGYQEDTL